MRAEQGEHTPDPDIHSAPSLTLGSSLVDVDFAAFESFQRIRRRSLDLCSPLEVEDFGIQPMDDASPPKWHLAHTSWFFETFILKTQVANYRAFHPQFEYLFNSYYNGVGKPYPRLQRGSLSRPTVAQIYAYREHVDAHMGELLNQPISAEARAHLALGLHHEQQHQELLLTDIKYNFGHNPLFPVYGGGPQKGHEASGLAFSNFGGGIKQIGTEQGFAFDNETPRHDVLVQPFALANRLVTNGEFLAFVEDDGYQQSHLWLSEGWSIQQSKAWSAPLYWHNRDGQWFEYRLDGLHELDPNLPVTHISAHEAFAYANWVGLRLPTEFEFEVAAQHQHGKARDGFVEHSGFHPNSVRPDEEGLLQMFGQAWQWTSSSYGPYPGYKPLPGTLGEYNGKFMSSQLVLRGASCVTPKGHVRAGYRNFFYPPDRWQFSGIRLAKDV